MSLSIGNISVPLTDRSTIVTGGSGTGKTFFLESLLTQIADNPIGKNVYVISLGENEHFKECAYKSYDLNPLVYDGCEDKILLFEERPNYTNPKATIDRAIRLVERFAEQSGEISTLVICDETAGSPELIKALDKLSREENFTVIMTAQPLKDFTDVLSKSVKDYNIITFGNNISKISQIETETALRSVYLLGDREDLSAFDSQTLGTGIIYAPDINGHKLFSFNVNLKPAYLKAWFTAHSSDRSEIKQERSASDNGFVLGTSGEGKGFRVKAEALEKSLKKGE